VLESKYFTEIEDGDNATKYFIEIEVLDDGTKYFTEIEGNSEGWERQYLSDMYF